MKILHTLLFILTAQALSFSQNPIDVYESTLKIKGNSEESYMCGLAEGDQLIFNFQEINGKELKELEILEYPNNSKFQDYKSSKIENKTINIAKTGIYKFRFMNAALTGRICKFKIQRIPANEQTKYFNTSVYYNKKSDTTVVNLTDQVSKVHSTTNANGNRTFVNFTLPENTAVWSYYIGVEQNGQESFNKATESLTKASSGLINSIIGNNPMVALALNATSYLSVLQTGEDIDYVITDNNNAILLNAGQPYKYFKSGKVINDFSRITDIKQGTLIICLSNDNVLMGVTVVVKVTAIVVKTIEEPYLKN